MSDQVVNTWRQVRGQCLHETQKSCLLMITLYGLKQSGCEWNLELDMKLKKHEFTRLKSDACVYTQWNNDDLEIMTIWVDDLMLFATSVKLMMRMKTDIQLEWDVTDLGEPAKIISIEIMQDMNLITISQKGYIDSVLRKQKMLHANPVAMLLDPNVKLSPNPKGNKGSKSNAYARLLRELQYIANATRPDITFAVNRLASSTANPTLEHEGALKRILCYLAGTKNLRITYSALPIHNNGGNLFQGYVDAAYSNTEEARLTSGYVFTVGGGVITWMSWKQSMAALSTTKSESVALSKASHEVCWLRNLFTELGFPQPGPTMIHSDNNGSIAMAKNPQFHRQAKHIETKWHHIRDLVEDGIISNKSCRDPEQMVDILTKALPHPKHKRHVQEMGLVSM